MPAVRLEPQSRRRPTQNPNAAILRVLSRRRSTLNGHVALVAAVPRQEDDGHASAPELALDRVAVR
jgi:hypothetical protein